MNSGLHDDRQLDSLAEVAVMFAEAVGVALNMSTSFACKLLCWLCRVGASGRL